MTLESTTVQASNVVALSAIASPAWLPSLEGTSSVAGVLLPILGVIWLLLQIGFFLHGRLKKDK